MTVGELLQTKKWGQIKSIISWPTIVVICWTLISRMYPSIPICPNILSIMAGYILAAFFFIDGFNFILTKNQAINLPFSKRLCLITYYIYNWCFSAILISITLQPNTAFNNTLFGISLLFLLTTSFGFAFQVLKNASFYDKTYFIRLLLLAIIIGLYYLVQI